MINKFGNILNTKKKAGVAVVGGALALMLGTGAVFAASPSNGKEKMLTRVENGVSTVSIDNGKTWKYNNSNGFVKIINKDGSGTSSVGLPPKDGKGMLIVQNINGTMKYSTDGGKTWSEKAPEGFKKKINIDGSLSVRDISKSNHAGMEMSKTLVRNVNGVISYSTDGGKTWKKGAPEGFKENINKDGGETSTVGLPPKDGKGLLVQNLNGTIKYSTDGGKTWSEKAPDGFTVENNGDGSLSVGK